ncbi:MAG: YkgJ family cysteine cluster protein [Phycisphaerales bacterium]
MASLRLTILKPPLDEQRYSCHGCGNCCRDFTVQLRDDDIERLNAQGWTEKLGESPIVEFRGTRFLKQRDDGACIFWMEDGRCAIHAEFGYEAKPIACQMFPFSLTPVEGGAMMGINFACQSVLENKGAALPTHERELRRMAGRLPEVRSLERPPMLTNTLRAAPIEVEAIRNGIDGWLARRHELPLQTRLDGLAWLIGSLHQAQLEHVREERFVELFATLLSALPAELELVEIDPIGRTRMRLLRQAAFARTEDPKISSIATRNRIAVVFGQWLRSRRFASGRGTAPHIAEEWPDNVNLREVETVGPAENEAETAAIDDLMTRWLRATVLGSRTWGAGYYGWPIVAGLSSMMLNVAVVSWLARLHARGNGRDGITIVDVRAALSRVDRASGRALWLGTSAEGMRVRYLARDHGLRSLVAAFPLVA